MVTKKVILAVLLSSLLQSVQPRSYDTSKKDDTESWTARGSSQGHPLPGTKSKSEIRAMVFLGDSNSDSGNAKYSKLSFLQFNNEELGLPGPLPDPNFYYGSRFCDGQVFGDVLYERKLFKDMRWYAVGFATACTQNSYSTFSPLVPSIQKQAERSFADSKGKQSPGRRAYGIFAGANDIGSAILSGSIFKDPSTVAKSIVDCTASTARYLVNNGETTIIIFNMSPEWELPYAQVPQPAVGNVTLRPFIEPVVNEVNELLEAAVSNLQKDLPQADIFLFDIFSIITEALSGKWVDILGTIDLNPCIVLADFNDLLKNPIPIVGKKCTDPEKHAFHDPFHYSSVIQQKVIAKSFIKFLMENGLLVDKN